MQKERVNTKFDMHAVSRDLFKVVQWSTQRRTRSVYTHLRPSFHFPFSDYSSLKNLPRLFLVLQALSLVARQSKKGLRGGAPPTCEFNSCCVRPSQQSSEGGQAFGSLGGEREAGCAVCRAVRAEAEGPAALGQQQRQQQLPPISTRREAVQEQQNAADPGLMRFVSSRGSPRLYSFTQALVAGAADDGGLLLPEAIPEVPLDVQDIWRRLSFPALLERILQLFIEPTDPVGFASQLTEALPRLVAAAFRETDKEALEVKAVRLLRRRASRADGSSWGSCTEDGATREKPSFFSVLLRAARERHSLKKAREVTSSGNERKRASFNLFSDEAGEGSGYWRAPCLGFDIMNLSASEQNNMFAAEAGRKESRRSRGMHGNSYAETRHELSRHLNYKLPSVAPYQPFASQIGNEEADELFLLSVKDGSNFCLNSIAMKCTAQLLNFLQARPEDDMHLIVLCATSGDTGLAAAEAFKSHPSIDLVVLFSRDISVKRRSQLTAAARANVFCVEVDGAYSECQAMVQGALRSRRLRHHLDLKRYIAEQLLQQEEEASRSLGRGASLLGLHRALSLRTLPSAGEPTVQQQKQQQEEEGGGEGPPPCAETPLLPFSRAQTRRYSLGHASGSFVRLPSRGPPARSRSKRFEGPLAAVLQQKPFRLAVIAPHNCVRLCAQIAFWWFAALKLQSLREEQQISLQYFPSAASSGSSSLVARDGSSATAPPGLSSSGLSAAPQQQRQQREYSTASAPPLHQSDASPGQQAGKNEGPPGGSPSRPDVVVPSGSYISLFSSYFALAMGAPLGQLVPSVSAASVLKQLGRNANGEQEAETATQQMVPPHSRTEPADVAASHLLLLEQQRIDEENEEEEEEAEEAERKEKQKGVGAQLRQSLSSSLSGLTAFFRRGGRPRAKQTRRQSQESDGAAAAGFRRSFEEETLSQDRETTVKSRLMRPFKGMARSVNALRPAGRMTSFPPCDDQRLELSDLTSFKENKPASLSNEGEGGSAAAEQAAAAELLRGGGQRVVDIAHAVARPGSIASIQPSFLATVTQLVLPHLGLPVGEEGEDEADADVRGEELHAGGCLLIPPELEALEDLLIERFCPECLPLFSRV
ncbi:hypothetical protein Efla_004866 [Eimeria flavescens]